MFDFVIVSGMLKVWFYYYYESKEVILFDLFDCYIKWLMLIIVEVEGVSQWCGFSECDVFVEFVCVFFVEYEMLYSCYVVLFNDVKYLEDVQCEIVFDCQCDIVVVFMWQFVCVYFDCILKENQIFVMMMVFGMINWIFIWLKLGGCFGYCDFVEQVIDLIECGLLIVV